MRIYGRSMTAVNLNLSAYRYLGTAVFRNLNLALLDVDQRPLPHGHRVLPNYDALM
eukprot:SAG31_NODE_2878_length_4963_cov_9.998150_5_plen_56_part_00